MLLYGCAVDERLDHECDFLDYNITQITYPEDKYIRSKLFSNPVNESEFGFIGQIDSIEGIWKYNLVTHQTTLITQAPIWSKPDWSTDDWIAFESDAQIFICKSNGDSLTQITFEGDNFYPSWSPDGNSMIIVNDDGSARRNYKLLSKSGEVIQTLDSTLYQSQPASWSPDGEKIAFIQSNGDGTTLPSYIYLNDPENVIKVATSTKLYFYGDVTWYPDSKRLLSTSGDNSIYEIDIEKGIYTKIASSCPYMYFGVTIQADGISLIEDRRQPNYREETNSLLFDIDLVKVKADGTEELLPY